MTIPAVQPRPCDCVRLIPCNTLHAVGKSAFYSFAAGTLFSMGNVTLGLYSAVGSAVATLIDSLIRPLINLFFSQEERRELFGIYFWAKTIAVCLIVGVIGGVLIGAGISFQINALASMATLIFLNLFPSLGTRRTDSRDADVYIFVAV